MISDGSSDEDDEHDVSGEAACGVAGAPSHGDDIVGRVVVEDEAEQAKGESTFVALPQPVTLEVQDGPLGLGLRSCSAKDLADAYSAELGYFATVNGMQGAAACNDEQEISSSETEEEPPCMDDADAGADNDEKAADEEEDV